MRYSFLSIIILVFFIIESYSENHRPYDEYNKKSNLELCLGDGNGLTIRNFTNAEGARDRNDPWLNRKLTGYAFVAKERGLDYARCVKLIKNSKSIFPNAELSSTNEMEAYIINEESFSNEEESFSNESEVNNLNEGLNIEKKLRQLKKLLDEGLISQEQYDEKSSKILEEF